MTITIMMGMATARATPTARGEARMGVREVVEGVDVVVVGVVVVVISCR